MIEISSAFTTSTGALCTDRSLHRGVLVWIPTHQSTLQLHSRYKEVFLSQVLVSFNQLSINLMRNWTNSMNFSKHFMLSSLTAGFIQFFIQSTERISHSKQQCDTENTEWKFFLDSQTHRYGFLFLLRCVIVCATLTNAGDFHAARAFDERENSLRKLYNRHVLQRIVRVCCAFLWEWNFSGVWDGKF